jgi:Cys-tRNA(Pro) deacylase
MNIADEREVPDGVKRVISIVHQSNVSYQLHSFEKPAHHASEAADLLQCPLGAVVKSLVFRGDATGEMVLVLVSGENRADTGLVNSLVGQPVRPAAPEDVFTETGFPVGAVPPFGLNGKYRTIIDADLMTYDRVWGSAGSAKILLGITPQDLQKLSKGSVECIKRIRDEK